MPLPIIHNNDGDNAIFNRIITQEEIMENIDEYRTAIAFYRSYPDLLVDLYIKASGPDCSFKLFPFQRILLRAMARYKNVFLTFSRGTSKSFLNNLWNIIESILYPNTHLAISASTKGQSSAIIEQKISEILSLIPALNFEILKTSKVKDQYTVYFKNGSRLENLAAKQSSRGMRFTGLTLEEVIEGDPDIIQEVILPTLAISRRAANGEFDKNEVVTQQQICVTTAGLKDTFSYNMLLKDLLQMVTEPGRAIVLGGSYRIPIIADLQSLDFIRDQKNSGSLNPTSFAREYLSRWAVGSENAYFPADSFDKYRGLQEPEFEFNERLAKGCGYVMGIDVGRFSDSSEVVIWKFIPQKGTTSTKHLMNIFSFENMPFDQQAVEIKALYERYKPVQVVIDGNGVGAGLVDELVKSQVDLRTNQFLRPWGVTNDDNNYYYQFRTADTIPKLLTVVKANATYNTQMYANFQTQLLTGKLRFLVNEQQIRMKQMANRTVLFKNMTEDQKADYLVPFIQTSILRDQMANLEEKRDGINIILDRTNTNMKKDKVSAAGMALYYIKTDIDDPAMRKQTMGWEQMLMQSTGKGGSSRSLPSITLKNKGKYTSRLKGK